MWRITSRLDASRWLEHTGSGWTADPETRLIVLDQAGHPQPMTPTGPHYTPTGADDPFCLYLIGMGAIPAPEVSGTPPSGPGPVPEPPGSPGLVY
ncbi:hypothetical protein AB8O64_19780 [Streptomyces sp. QH1-20]|uniref:hypothetical protein n=1 Tax=Streptomyces sp. QH1-20 TaxID=3240934 RepID=UPI0035118185